MSNYTLEEYEQYLDFCEQTQVPEYLPYEEDQYDEGRLYVSMGIDLPRYCRVLPSTPEARDEDCPF